MSNISPQDVLPILRKHLLVDGFELVVDLEKSRDVRLYDTLSGSTYLDLFSFFSTAPLGFNHPRLVSQDFKDRIMAAAINKPSNSDFYTIEMAEFVDAFSRAAIPAELPNLFLISGGALGVENAIKAAFDWKVRRNFARGRKEETGHQVIHFREAFHGRTGYTLSLTNTDETKTKYFARFDWPRITNPKITFPVNDENLERVKTLEARALNEIDDAIKTQGDDIAALIIEPIQGEGGDNHFRREFFQALRTITLENDIILIFDEVQTGMGTTGEWWAYQHFGVVPDIISFGKKTQVCGMLAGNRLREVENNVFEESGRLNSTWGGNLADMIRFTRYLEVMQEEDLVAHTREVGAYFLEQLIGLQFDFDGLVTNARGRGFFLAFDLPTPELRRKCLGQLFENHVIGLASGERSIRFRPPLILTKTHVDEGMEKIEAALKTL